MNMHRVEQAIVDAMKCKHDAHLSKRDAVYYDAQLDTSTYRLWRTDVAVIHWREQYIAFRHGGWLTPTTKSRINAIAYAFTRKQVLSQKGGIWYLNGEQWLGIDTDTRILEYGQQFPTLPRDYKAVN
jgi:hypothetical protein